MTSIVLRDVSKAFGERRVFAGLDFAADGASFTTLIGPNGSGKSTLLNLIAGTLMPDAGEVIVRADHADQPRAGYVWQDYRSSLLPWFDVADNIAFPLRIRGAGRDERRRAAEAVLERFALPIHPRQRVYQLSGGQQQLVSLFRSLVVKPDFLLLDEPFSALDQQTRWTMAFHVERIWMQHRVPTLFVSHDVDEAILLADRILLLSRSGGRIAHTIANAQPRPRNVRMLTAAEHIRCRQEVIEFLFEQGAVRDDGDRG